MSTYPQITRPETYSERFSTRYYLKDKDGKENGQYIFVLRNGICVVGLSRDHPLVTDKKVKSLTWTVQDFNPNTKVSKKKIGSVQCKGNEVLCHITDDSGASTEFKPFISGTLMELNDRLLEEPALLSTSPENEGFVAVVFPNKQELQRVQEQLSAASAAPKD